MHNKRQSERLTYISKCVLEQEGRKISGLLEDISTAGALVSTCEDVSDILHVGDVFQLKVCLIGPVEYAGKICHLSPSKIGLQFFDE